MEPSGFDQANTNLGPPVGVAEAPPDGDAGVRTLRVFRGEFPDGDPATISCWRPSEAELEEIARTGRIWMICVSPSMPPTILTATSPFPP